MRSNLMKRIMTLVLTVALITGFAPAMPNVKADDYSNKVHVIVENYTYSQAAGAAWEGELVNTWVEADDSLTMTNAIASALAANNYTCEGAENDYITSVNGLGAISAYEGGWMATLNDWFTNEGMGAYTVANGKLAAGDEIRLQYTRTWGADVGSDYAGNDKSLKALTVSTGTFDSAFASDTKNYALTVPEGTAKITVTPTAVNKNYQVKTYVGDTEYKRTAEVPVSDGTLIKIVCGDPTWPSMNNGTYGSGAENVPAETYYIFVRTNEATVPVYPSDDAGDDSSDTDDSDDSQNTDDSEDAVSYTYTEMLDKTAERLAGSVSAESTSYSDWVIMGLARSGKLSDDVKAAYIKSIENKVSENASDKISGSRSTDNSRTIIALSSLNYDVTDVAGYNLLAPLADYQYVTRQGLNGPVYALIALDTKDYEIPQAASGTEQTTRDALISYILDRQISDGGWAYMSDAASSDTDMTAMAIQALAPYYNTNAEVKTAVDKALNLISSKLKADGTFDSTYGVSPETQAQIIVALTALGIDPAKDARFVLAEGKTVFDGLSLFYLPDEGGYSYIAGDAYNSFSTEQAYYGLVAYSRFANNGTPLYDMTDVKDNTEATTEVTTEATTEAATGATTETADNDKSPATGDETAVILSMIITMAAVCGMVKAARERR